MQDSTSKSDTKVIEVRRHLNEIRKLWRQNAPITPFYAAATISETKLTASEFAFYFVRSHHQQRGSKKVGGETL